MPSLDIRVSVVAAAPPPPGSLPARSIRLDFADGKSLTFDQSGAEDIGDYVSPVGGFTQKCFRQRASGNGDYRDGFVVFFRPDANGKRTEVVVEYGTEYDFPAGKPPAAARGVVPMHLFVPPFPALAKAPGGSATTARRVYVYTTWVAPGGETVASSQNWIDLVTGERVVVRSPAGPVATGYNIYAMATGAKYYRQNAEPVPLGTDWTEDAAAGLVTSGPTLPAKTTLIAYTATISGADLAQPVVIPVANHWWDTRWRWQSARRPVVRSWDDLVAMKATLPLDKAFLFNKQIPQKGVWTGPMGTGGLVARMNAPGDRPDLGLVTEYTAIWALTGNKDCLTTMLAQAEAVGGSVPFWCRDAATGNFVDISAHPYITFGDALRGPYQVPKVPVSSDQAQFYPAVSHMPAACFIPALLTDDPYFWEGLMGTVQNTVLETNLYQYNQKHPHLVDYIEPRGGFWAMRDIFSLAAFGPEKVPSWMQPRSHWRDYLPDNLAHYQRYLALTASPCTTVFGLVAPTSYYDSFEYGYGTLVLAWAVLCGFEDWRPILEYICRFRLIMSDHTGASGWDARNPAVYDLPLYNLRQGAAAALPAWIDVGIADSPDTPRDGADAWACYLRWAAHYFGAKWRDPSTWAPGKLSPFNAAYYPELRGVLAALALVGVPNAREQHDWMTVRLRDQYPDFGVTETFKWAVPPE